MSFVYGSCLFFLTFLVFISWGIFIFIIALVTMRHVSASQSSFCLCIVKVIEINRFVHQCGVRGDCHIEHGEVEQTQPHHTS